MKRNKRTFGFTLVEIMIVVTIIGILASLAVPAFQKARWKAVETSVRNNLRQIWGAAQQYMLENGVDQVDFESIVAWHSKNCGDHGTNGGYTSVIQQVSSENYSSLIAVRGCGFSDMGNANSNENRTGTAKILYEDSAGIMVTVPGTGSCDRYVKLNL